MGVEASAAASGRLQLLSVIDLRSANARGSAAGGVVPMASLSPVPLLWLQASRNTAQVLKELLELCGEKRALLVRTCAP